jgi:hypothetical protein
LRFWVQKKIEMGRLDAKRGRGRLPGTHDDSTYTGGGMGSRTRGRTATAGREHAQTGRDLLAKKRSHRFRDRSRKLAGGGLAISMNVPEWITISPADHAAVRVLPDRVQVIPVTYMRTEMSMRLLVTDRELALFRPAATVGTEGRRHRHAQNRKHSNQGCSSVHHHVHQYKQFRQEKRCPGLIQPEPLGVKGQLAYPGKTWRADPTGEVF